jgi:hypothetical protein
LAGEGFCANTGAAENRRQIAKAFIFIIVLFLNAEI